MWFGPGVLMEAKFICPRSKVSEQHQQGRGACTVAARIDGSPTLAGLDGLPPGLDRAELCELVAEKRS